MARIRRTPVVPVGATSLALALAVFAGGSATAHEEHSKPAASAAVHGNSPPPQEVTVRGELIDPQCWFTHVSRGPEHASCARMCAKGGQDLAFLHEATGVVYPLIAAGHGKDPNANWIEFVGKPLQVKGTIYRIGPNAVMLLQSVTAL